MTALPLVKEDNSKAIREEIDLVEEKMNSSPLLSTIAKQAKTSKYNKRVRPQEFKLNNLVFKCVDVGHYKKTCLQPCDIVT